MAAKIKYIYDLPLFSRKELCRIIDETGKWEDLGGNYMNLSVSALREIQRNTTVRAISPTDYLLDLLGQKNHTIDYLFVMLSKMQHYRAMSAIKDFVDPKLLPLMYDGECNLSRIVTEKSEELRRPTGADVGHSVRTAGALGHSSSSALKSTDFRLNLDRDDAKKVTPKVIPAPVRQDKPELVTGTGKQPTLSMLQREPAVENSVTNNVLVEGVDVIRPTPATQDGGANTSGSQFLTAYPPQYCQVPFLEFRQVVDATNNFHDRNKLGKGGFGTVFRGNWQNTEVAIKRLEYRSSAADEKDDKVAMEQILVEFTSLRRYAHDNILPLYAYSVGGEFPCLVYKLMPRGSLEDRLQCKPISPVGLPTAPLTWKIRANIALGVARGLQFLHNVHEKPLIHGDVKSGNILLDENYEPKIGDFGLAREGPDKGQSSMLASKIQGTRPYLPPEFLKSGRRSTKVDVYSFGIVLFEIAVGDKAAGRVGRPYLLGDWVKHHNRSGTIMQIIDPKMPSPSEYELAVYRLLIDLGLRCTTEDAKQRPDMKVVYDELWREMAQLGKVVAAATIRSELVEESSDSEQDEDSDEMMTDQSAGQTNEVIASDLVSAGLPLISLLLAQPTSGPETEESRNPCPAPIPDFAALGIGPEVDTVKLGEVIMPLVLLSQENNATARAVTALLPAITALFSNKSLSGGPWNSLCPDSQRARRKSAQKSGEPKVPPNIEEGEKESGMIPALSALYAKPPVSAPGSSKTVPPARVHPTDESTCDLPNFAELNLPSSVRKESLNDQVPFEDNSVQSGYSSSIFSAQSDSSDDEIVVPTASKKKMAF